MTATAATADSSSSSSSSRQADKQKRSHCQRVIQQLGQWHRHDQQIASGLLVPLFAACRCPCSLPHTVSYARRNLAGGRATRNKELVVRNQQTPQRLTSHKRLKCTRSAQQRAAYPAPARVASRLPCAARHERKLRGPGATQVVRRRRRIRCRMQRANNEVLIGLVSLLPISICA